MLNFVDSKQAYQGLEFSIQSTTLELNKRTIPDK